jgi:hypothetical protein
MRLVDGSASYDLTEHPTGGLDRREVDTHPDIPS